MRGANLKTAKLEIARSNKHEQNQLRLDQLRSLVTLLPLVIAQRPFDTASTDYLFVEACNLTHKRQYAKALNVLKGALEFAKDNRSKEMLLFN